MCTAAEDVRNASIHLKIVFPRPQICENRALRAQKIPARYARAARCAHGSERPTAPIARDVEFQVLEIMPATHFTHVNSG